MILRTKLLVLVAALVSAAFAGCLSGKAEGDGVPIAVLKTTAREDGVTFLFDATNSTDPDGSASDLFVEWNFGDDGLQTGKLLEFGLIEYTYAVTDTTFIVSLVVRDADGKASFAMEPVTLGSGVNTPPQIEAKNATRWIQADSGIVLDAARSADADGDSFSYEWFVGAYDEAAASATLATQYLDMGQSENLTLEAPGVYQFHCHPHPWMRTRVIVSDGDPNATASPTVDIANFAYSPHDLVVTPGTTVQFRNLDPTPHTATLEWFAPGKAESTSPVLSKKLPAGDHQARLVLNDGKGGQSTATWGLRASADAPANPLTTDMSVPDYTYVAEVPTGSPDTGKINNEYLVDWVQNLTVSISWTTQQSNVPSGSGNFWNIFLDDADGKALAAGYCEEGTCSFVTNVMPGQYFLRAQAQQTFTGSIAWTAVATQYSYPGFGDAVACPPGSHAHNGVCQAH